MNEEVIFVFVFFGILAFGALIAFSNVKSIQQSREDAEKRQAKADFRSDVDTALRGVASDLARHKAGLQPLGFESNPALQKFIASAFAVDLFAPPQAPAVVATPATAPEQVEADDRMPCGDVTVLLPDRIISSTIAVGVHVVIGFYADTYVGVRTIHVDEPLRYGLPASDYSLGQVEATGRTDEQLLSDAVSVAPGTFLQLVTDERVEQALRIRAA